MTPAVTMTLSMNSIIISSNLFIDNRLLYIMDYNQDEPYYLISYGQEYYSI